MLKPRFPCQCGVGVAPPPSSRIPGTSVSLPPREWSSELEKSAFDKVWESFKKRKKRKRYIYSLILLNLGETRDSAKGSFYPHSHITRQDLAVSSPPCMGTHRVPVGSSVFP